MNNKYKGQDRGSDQAYLQYLEAMDAISIEKVASASVFFEPKEGNIIVDVGMASGTSTAILAKLFPNMSIIGIDINPKMVEIAKSTYQDSNLFFRPDDGELLKSFEPNSVNGFFNCSTIHHITSYNGYDNNRAIQALRRQVELLCENGVLIVRDFVKPEEKEIIVEFSTISKDERPDDASLFIQFSRSARSLADVSERGFPIKEIDSNFPNVRRFKAFLTDVTEFIRRKDYYSNWDIELQEEYGYFTQKDFENLFNQLNLRIIISYPIYNQWIINNRYKNQFKLFNLEGDEIDFPATNYLIAGEKTTKGKQIQLVRHLPLITDSFLQYESFENIKDAMIWDVVHRPNLVYDIIPFYKNESRLIILAKHGYPRPLATIHHSQSPIIDGKKYSGYIPECISITSDLSVEDFLEKDFGITTTKDLSINNSLQYYSSPGGINEKINSKFVRFNEKFLSSEQFLLTRSGFRNSGFVHEYDAVQLLNTAQTGALLEARLELNIYNLFFKENFPLPNWLGERLTINQVFELNEVSLLELLSIKSNDYVKSKKTSNFLTTHRALFTEIGVGKSQAILEYVFPSNLSSNTLIALPVCRYNDQVFVGLEVRSLPVPQLYTGNSTLLTVPAYRLPYSVTDRRKLELYLSKLKIGNSNVMNYVKLGEKYFPSIGITTEQVYPFVVCLDEPSNELNWVKLTDLVNNMENLEDAHLLIAICRFTHMMK